MKNINEIPKRYNLLVQKYSLIVITVSNALPLNGIVGLIDWWLFGEITKIIKTGRFSCNYGELLLFFSDNLYQNNNFLLFGLGNNTLMDKHILDRFVNDLKVSLESLKVKNFALLINDGNESYLNKVFKEFAIDVYV
ncbi:MAG: hypothetical protein N2202_05250 [Proteobacteria bacterium]|nr:hypothetical protein [Pseudomonadota bacterium]